MLLIGFSAESAGAPRDQTRPYRIGRIIIFRKEVFDEKRADWFGSFANKLHVVTREDFIRNELLFREGDVYDPDALEESERNLRALGFVGDVSIVADTVRNRRVNIRVYTHDRWTLGVNGTYKQEGGVRNLGFSLNEDNFMGGGQGMSVGYNYRSDRNNPHGAELDFVERRLFGSHFGLHAKYVNSEDARVQTLAIQRTFFMEAATWAGSVYTDFGQQRFRQYQDGTLVLQDNVKRENQNAWFALSSGPRTKYRVGLAYIRTRMDSRLVPATYFDKLDLLNLGLSISRRVFYKGRFIENFGRVEDVPLGYNLSLIIGKNFHASRASMADMYVRFDGEYALAVDRRYYLSLQTALSGFRDGRNFKDATLRQTLLTHWRSTERTTLVGKIDLVRGYNWSAGRQLMLGTPTGLPGYGVHTLTGQQELLVNVQYRFFSPLSFWIFSFGGALFGASGTAWEGNQSFSRQRFHTSAGFGLRIENSTQQGSGIIRIDFPFNFDERRFTEVVISSDQLFKAFSDLLFVAPNVIQ